MRVFIIRPFGTQENIDFEKVESDLIQPALKRLRELGVDVAGGTTGEIAAAGNIREDMFRLIAVSDLVVADVTIHNANAYYELGIRHALCPRFTVMIREKNTKMKYPFDLQTDRYFNYDYGSLAASVGALATTLQSTLARTDERDSPIFTLLPKLEPHGRGKLVKVPESFVEEVTLARRTGSLGDLRLLAYECAAFEWDQEGLQVVGDAQFKLRAYAGARDTFELLRKASPNHYHANWRLGTIYQRLAAASQDLMKAKYDALSDDAISRALGAASGPAEVAEQHSLKGSNAKNHWTAEYRAAPPEKRAQRALESPNLENMLGHYMRAAACDLDSHYPTVNVLAFLRVQTLLARANPQVWDGMHDSGADELKRREDLVTHVAATLRLALRLDPEFEKYQTAADDWAASSIADFTLLCTPDKTAQVSRRYREANANADWFTLEANKRNLLIFKELGLLEPGVTAAVAAIDEVMATKSPPGAPPKRVVLFSGHMVDRPDRPPEQARFPATAKAMGTARQLIKDALMREVGGDAGNTRGIAGGACGGDILFHDVCAELGIRTDLYLLLPPDKFQVASVNHGGADWVDRYQKLCASKKDSIRQLQDDKPLPHWLTDRQDYSIWERNNLWLMFNALAVGADNATLLALFNAEREADGPGGTKHLIELAKEHGFKPLMVDATPLLG